MESHGVNVPRISRSVLRLFSRYSGWYLGRSFRAIRIAGRAEITQIGAFPLVICLNHASWWDPLVCLQMAQSLFPERRHYAPMEAAALGKYRFFERLGFFGVEPGTVRGAGRFLEIGGQICKQPNSTLWITAQGKFADPRVRPVTLRSGIGHLIQRTTNPVVILPLAIEYPFWTEKLPECLARFGAPVLIPEPSSRTAADWTRSVAQELERTQDRLAEDAIAHRHDSFEVLLRGRTGVGGVYDLWRSGKARLQGRRFQRAHGTEL